ncbi:MAG: ATP-dependent metallopeptidase FtsH/Yme1/Tma family protein [Campylobacterales bacterium]|nr:ATP-dependent metallopeptidase FtsH/Yme1/Tma family protein [Campylobacterales bacterium]
MQTIVQNFKIEKNIKAIIALVVLLIVLLLYSALRDRSNVITLQEADRLIKQNAVVSVLQDKNYFYFYTDKRAYKIAKDAVDNNFLYRKYKVEIRFDRSKIYYTFLALFLVLIVIYLIKKLNYSNEMIDQTPLRANKHQKEEEEIKAPKIYSIQSDIGFKDIAGISEAKEELSEIIDFLKSPQKYKKLHIKLPKGVLLVGPPGVGKTYIAKAVAGEANVPFFYQSGASFVHIYVGVGASRVKELFREAKRQAPSIIFIDEIDSVGKKRGEHRNDEREATLNQLLTEMDGFEDSSGVMVIGATNNIESMDSALLRSGRFDRRVEISLPDMEDRQKVLELYLADKKHDVDIEQLARVTVGLSNASLATLVNEAGLYAIKQGRESINDDDFEAIREKVVSGRKKIKSLTYKERELQALYQSAKAIVATWYDVEFDKIGIVTTKLVENDVEILSRNQILDRAKIFLAGAIATQKHYHDKFTNAKEDIKYAKSIIDDMNDKYFMGDNFSSSLGAKEQIYHELKKELEELIAKLDTVLDRVTTYMLCYENIDQAKVKEILREVF